MKLGIDRKIKIGDPSNFNNLTQLKWLKITNEKIDFQIFFFSHPKTLQCSRTRLEKNDLWWSAYRWSNMLPSIRTRKSVLDSWGYSSSGIWTDVDNNRPCVLVSRIVDDRERGLCCVVLLCCMHSYLTDRESAIFAFEITKRSACFPAISIDFAPWRKQQTSLPFTNTRSILSWPSSFIQNSPSNDIPSIF